MSEREELVAVRVAEDGEPIVVQISSADFVAAICQHEKCVRGMKDGTRAVLSHQDLSGLRLPNLNLRGAILVGTDFSRSDVSGTDFSHADLFTANFDNAKAEGTNFQERPTFAAPIFMARRFEVSTSRAPTCVQVFSSGIRPVGGSRILSP